MLHFSRCNNTRPERTVSVRAGSNTSMDAMIRACQQESSDIRTKPFDAIGQALQLNSDQQSALQALRNAADATTKTLDGGCPGS